MPDHVKAAAVALVRRYGDMAFDVANRQVYAVNAPEHVALWKRIADTVSEINRTRVAAILDETVPDPLKLD